MIPPRYLLDTGPLAAFLNRRDRHHNWAKDLWARAQPPMLTCEPALAETCFLLRDLPGASLAVMELIQRGVLAVPFRVEDHALSLGKLMRKYQSAPMSLADACLVRMAELTPSSIVATLDGHYRIYRKHGRHAIPLAMPESIGRG